MGREDSSDGVMVEMAGSQPRGQEEQAVWATALQVGKEVWAGDKCLAVSSTETVVETTVPGGWRVRALGQTMERLCDPEALERGD